MRNASSASARLSVLLLATLKFSAGPWSSFPHLVHGLHQRCLHRQAEWEGWQQWVHAANPFPPSKYSTFADVPSIGPNIMRACCLTAFNAGALAILRDALVKSVATIPSCGLCLRHPTSVTSPAASPEHCVSMNLPQRGIGRAVLSVLRNGPGTS